MYLAHRPGFKTSDIQEAIEASRHAFRSMTVEVLAPEFFVEIHYAALAILQVTSMLSVRRRVAFETNERYYALIWWPHEAEHSVLLVPPDTKGRYTVEDDTETVGVRIAASDFRKQASALLGEPPPPLMRALPLAPGPALEESLRRLVTELDNPGGLFDGRDPVGALGFEQRLLALILEEVYRPFVVDDPLSAAGGRIQELIRFIRKNLYRAIGPREMAHHLGVTRRTMQNDCLSQRRMSPLILLETLRLYEMFWRLENARPRDTVASIARELHLGRLDLTARYRALFDEIPEATQARRRTSDFS